MDKKLSFIDLVEKFIAEDRVVLPVFSTTAMKIQQELVKKEPAEKLMVSLISSDQSLASQVLQTANSAFYKGLVEVTTIRGAIVRLGMPEVGRIALLSATKDQFHSKNKKYSMMMRKLWQHSVGCAMAARWLAVRGNMKELESEAFFGALFHDIGKLFVLMIIEQMSRTGNDMKMTDSLLLEVMGSLHCQQGYNLLKKWNIPDEYCLIARDHHTEAFDVKKPLQNIVRLADMACNKLGIGTVVMPDLVLSSTDEAKFLNISEIALAELEIMLEDTKILAG